MKNRHRDDFVFCAIFIAVSLGAAVPNGTAPDKGELLTGRAAMGDWKSDAPGVRRKITVQDLPPPTSNILAINRARVVNRPGGVPLRVPSGFRIELYAEGFRDPRFLLTAQNGDIFV